MRRVALLIGLVVALLACTTSLTPAAVDAGVPSAAGTCPTFEATIDGAPAVANPFDPAQADVQVTFTAPSGSTSTVPAFFTRDFSRALVGSNERLTATSSGYWAVRFTPTESGTWSWSTSTSIGGGPPAVSSAATFTCSLDASSRGFLRRSTDDPRYLRWEDGTPYTAIGENLAWYDQRGTFAYDSWLDQLAAHGSTWIRVWMPSWAFGLETLTRGPGGVIVQNSLGDYTTRLDRAWQLDYVIDAARERGIVVQLVIQNHGAFTTGANTEWDNNPYNAANGGPLTDPTQVFTSSTAKELMARRIRYVSARWGYATNLVWEFWNEVDLTNAAPADIVAWHAEMGDLLRELDPYDHLQTTSVNGGLLSSAATWMPLFELPQIDLTGLHFYGIGTLVPLDFTTFVPTFMAPLLALGKPALLAEAGVDFRGPAETIAADPTGQGFHELVWTGLFTGGYGSGMTWWWDNVVDPNDQYDTLDGFGALVSGVALDREHWALGGATATTGTDPLQAFGLRGDRTALVWVRNPANWWHQPDFTTITGATLTVDGLHRGSWKVEWVDPYSGAITDGGTISVHGAHTSIPLPNFEREVAVRLTLQHAQTSHLDCGRIAGTGKYKPGLADDPQQVALSLKGTFMGPCTGDVVDQTGPLTAFTGKVVGSASCAAPGDALRPLAGKFTLVWTTLDTKGKPVKSVAFVRLAAEAGVADGHAIANGLVTKGPGVGMDVSGGFLAQPTRTKTAEISTIDSSGAVVPGAGSQAIATGCATGTTTVDTVVFGTDGTSLLGQPFDSSISFDLPT